jgi:hypothetical protein
MVTMSAVTVRVGDRHAREDLRRAVLSDEVCVVVVIDHVAGPAGPVVTGAA